MGSYIYGTTSVLQKYRWEINTNVVKDNNQLTEVMFISSNMIWYAYSVVSSLDSSKKLAILLWILQLLLLLKWKMRKCLISNLFLSYLVSPKCYSSHLICLDFGQEAADLPCSMCLCWLCPEWPVLHAVVAPLRLGSLEPVFL